MTAKPLIPDEPASRRDPSRSEEALRRISEALKDLAYGAVTVVVQDGVVVQIDRTEKVRLGRPINGT